MGQLKPDVSYVYERVNDIVYAREVGADPSSRQIVGYDYKFAESNPYFESIARKYFFEQEWLPILDEADHNLVLRDAIERVKILYHLSKDHGKE